MTEITDSKRSPYRRDIDGLRAIAVILVLLFHAFPRALPGGFIGVDIFFVISGFLITGIILSSEFTYASFYAHRARRLFPALVVVVTFSLIAGWFLLTPAQFEELGKQAMAAALFVPNFLFWSQAGYFDPAAVTKPLLHLWSLGVEEQYYLFGPAILLVALRYRIKANAILISVIVVSLLCCLAFKTVWHAPSLVFYWPICRAWEIAAGGLVSIAIKTKRNEASASLAAVAGICVILFAAITINGDAGWPAPSAIAVVAGSMLVIYSGADSPLARNWLGSATMVFIGKISYPLYLWHWPILTFLFLKNGEELSTITAVLALFVSGCLATATYLFVEQPLRNGLPLKTVAASASAALLFAGTLGLFVRSQHGMPWRLPAALQNALAYERYDFAIDAYSPGCWLGNNELVSNMLPVCLQTSRSDSIAIWGDSHAERLSPGLRLVFGADRVSQLTRNSCAPLLGLSLAGDGCKEGNDAVLNILKKIKPKTVILFGAWQNYTTDWRPPSTYGAMLAKTLESVKLIGIPQVILIGPSPRYQPDLPSALLRDWSHSHWSELPDRIKVNMQDTYRIDRDFADISSSLGIQYVSALRLFCGTDGCRTKRPTSESDLLTWDYGHLTTDGAKMLANDLQSIISQRALTSKARRD